MDPLDFIAELAQHIPEPRRHLGRYFGFYSNNARGLRALTFAGLGVVWAMSCSMFVAC